MPRRAREPFSAKGLLPRAEGLLPRAPIRLPAIATFRPARPGEIFADCRQTSPALPKLPALFSLTLARRTLARFNSSDCLKN
ncbi:hypothetical protein A2U01_0059890, partial [Trifolium medium]|nr:hypothetical protein [Trifolium medium]